MTGFQNIALFGASGQIGTAILAALLDPPTSGYKPSIRVFISPGSDRPPGAEGHARCEVVELDYKQADREELAKAFKGSDALVSALNGPGIQLQTVLLDAAVDAGVKRFIPSEFGFHHTFRTPEEPGARMHPMWDDKEKFNEWMQLHPDVEGGKITYTLIGAGDFYDQAREEFWCPWMQDRPSYTLPIVGDPDVPVDWSCITDNGRYVAAVLAAPDRTANKSLNFPSWTAPQAAFAEVLRAHVPGRPVKIRHFSLDEARGLVKSPEKAPKEVQDSPFPADFWFNVKTIQGEGRGRRPRTDVHNDMFPEVKPTTFEDFLKQRAG